MENKLKGGKADKINNIQDLYSYWAKIGYSKGGISKSLKKQLEYEISLGKTIEREHSSDEEKIKEIVFDHLVEFPDYYTRLKNMEKKAEKEIQTESNKNLIKNLLRENLSDRKEYLSWKRKNVTLRGISNAGNENNAGAAFGEGLYTAFLGNKEMAKKYGQVYFVVNAIPKKPKIVSSVNEAEIFLQTLVTIFCKEHGVPRSNYFFSEKTSVAQEIIKMGYDGFVIKGREMVNYKPKDILYFTTEDQLYRYYLTL